jgi:hypothetical protein
MLRYSLTIFLSAFLMFQIQPLVARAILPWFGGTAAVWASCMLFFQSGLLLGYGFVHALRLWVRPKTAWYIQIALLLLAANYSYPIPAEKLQPDGNENLAFSVFWILALTIGIPFFLVSTSGPLIQAWQSLSHPHRSPYPLFALSNFGSLVALLSYPLVTERYLATWEQGRFWQIGFLIFGVLVFASGLQIGRDSTWIEPPADGITAHPNRSPRSQFLPLIWMLLSMNGSTLFLATTNLMTQEIASVPLLWVLPLSIYLVSFMICFDFPKAYQRALFAPALAISAIAAVVVVHLTAFLAIGLQIRILCTICFFGTMTCHGELERLKPNPGKLTSFYLAIAVGGALGGLLVAVVAPLLFAEFYEFQLSLLATMMISMVALFLGRERALPNGSPERWSPMSTVFRLTCQLLLLISISCVLCSLAYLFFPGFRPNQIHRERSQYGVLAVEESGNYRRFVHGNIEHGGQFLDKVTPQYSRYYYPESGIALALGTLREKLQPRSSTHLAKRRLNVGIVGLGIGGVLAWAERGDRFTFYELDPAVERIARKYFTFLIDSAAETQVLLGDGRLQLKRRLDDISSSPSEPKAVERFDLLFLDAFSSDAIPIHLMTEEAFAIYLEALSPEGIVVVHITNRFVDLRPVLYHHAERFKLTPVYIESIKSDRQQETRWILLSRDPGILDSEMVKKHACRRPPDMLPIRWTDDYSSLMDVIKWVPSQ